MRKIYKNKGSRKTPFSFLLDRVGLGIGLR